MNKVRNFTLIILLLGYILLSGLFVIKADVTEGDKLAVINRDAGVIIAKNNNAIVGIDALTHRMKLGEQGVLLGNNGNSGIFDVIEKESPTFTNGIVFNMGTKTSIKIPRA